MADALRAGHSAAGRLQRLGHVVDWDFVPGGKGYTGDLEELVQDFGIEVQ
ncbi:hypothetical protein ABZ464_28750 [Streptomyces sp. NPDC005820]